MCCLFSGVQIQQTILYRAILYKLYSLHRISSIRAAYLFTMIPNTMSLSVLYRVLLLSFAAVAIGGCSQEEKMFELRFPVDTGITFQNKLTSNDSINLLNFEYFYNGGGVAVGDVNNDGLQDVYFTGNMVSGKLYLNEGDLKFEDITEQAKVETMNWATGASMVDINSDGLLDIYVCMSGYKDPDRRKNLLFINQGLNADKKPQFKEEAEKIWPGRYRLLFSGCVF